MELIKNIHEDEFGDMEGQVYFKFFDKYIDINFEKDVPMDYVMKNAKYLNSISEDVILKLCEYSFIYCKDFTKAYPDIQYDEGLIEISKPSKVLKYMEICSLKVDMPQDETTCVLNLSGGCDWEDEDGMQWLIRDDEVIYVGSWDDLDPWMESLDKGWCNYVTGWRLNF